MCAHIISLKHLILVMFYVVSIKFRCVIFLIFTLDDFHVACQTIQLLIVFANMETTAATAVYSSLDHNCSQLSLCDTETLFQCFSKAICLFVAKDEALNMNQPLMNLCFLPVSEK